MEIDFTGQLKAAKNISATCRWILDQVQMQRISNTRNDWFEKSHFTKKDIVSAAINGLGLSDKVPFVPDEKIIEWRYNTLAI